MAWRIASITTIVILLLVFTSGTVRLSSPQAALAQPPPPIIYSGQVTIGGQPPADGTEVYARIGTQQSEPATIVNGRYSVLVVNVLDSSFIGQEIQFFIDGVRALETDIFIEAFFLEKELDLNFPELPLTGDSTFPLIWWVLAGVGGLSLLSGVFMLRRYRRSA